MTTHVSGDTAVLTGRSLRHITRSPDTIITTAIMPIALLLLFVYVFGGTIHTGPQRYVTYLLPGILLITIAMGISYTAVRLFTDMQSGIFERFQSMPIARSSALWAHVLTSLVANLISLVLVVLVAVAMGFRTGAGALAWLAVAGILFLMFRYREQLRAGEDPKQAMVSAVTRVGEVIASAAGVVIVAFLVLLLSTLSVLRSIGPALAIAVAVTLIAGLTLVPAVVSLLGPRVFWPSKAWRREPKAARFAAISRSLGRLPAAFAVVSGLVLVVLAIGAFAYKPTFDLSAAGIPAHAESQTPLKTLERGLPPGATDPTVVLLHSTSGQPLTAAEDSAFLTRLKTLPGVGR